MGEPASSSEDEAHVVTVTHLDAPDSDFFCNDGEHEDIHPRSAFLNTARDSNKKKLTNLKKGGNSDEEYCSSDDSVELAYKDKKSRSSSSVRKLKSLGKGRSALVSPNTNSSSAASQSLVSFTPLGEHAEDTNTFAKALKLCAMKKRTGEDYKPNTMDDIGVFLTNKTSLYSTQSVKELSDDPQTLTQQHIERMNIKLDRQVVQFLVQFVTTRIGSEIALQRCLIDYILQKQYLNRIAKSEQQQISNWEEIFVTLENLILEDIATEYDGMHNVILAAQQRTRSMLVMNSNIQRQRIADDSTLSEIQKNDKNLQLEKDLESLILELCEKAEPEKASVARRRRYAKSRVHTTLHHTCVSVCVMWLEANNGLDHIDQDKLRLYYIRSNADKATLSELKDNAITKNGMFVMSSNLLELADDGSSVAPTEEHLKTEQEQLERILNDDHVNNLIKTIKSVPDDVSGIQKLIQICWSKAPRVRLTHAVSKVKAKKVSFGEDNKDVKTSFPPSTPTATAVDSASLASAAVGTQKLTSFYHSDKTSIGSDIIEPKEDIGKSGSGGNTTELVSSSFPLAVATPLLVTGHAISIPVQIARVGLADPKSTLSRIAEGFDSVIRIFTRRINAACGDHCLQLQMKSAKRDAMLERLKFFHMLLANVKKDDAGVLSALTESTFYDMFESNWLFRAKEIDSSNTRGDGYCFTRGKAQCKFRQDSDFKVGVKEMREFDSKNNSLAADNTNEAFKSFICDLPDMMKEESGPNHSFVTHMGEMVWYKHKKQLEMMPALLILRGPGSALGEMFWGDLSTVTMLSFNVTCVSKLLEGSFDNLIKKDRNKWVKYEASSVPMVRDKKSLQRSRRPLCELDQVVSQELNLLYYYKPHFCVIGNPERGGFERGYTATKVKCVSLLMERVRLVEELVPDALRQLEAILNTCEGRDGGTNYEDFPVNSYEQKFAKKWPDAYVVDEATVDLTGEDEEPAEAKEITRLREALELSNAKVILAFLICRSGINDLFLLFDHTFSCSCRSSTMPCSEMNALFVSLTYKCLNSVFANFNNMVLILTT